MNRIRKITGTLIASLSVILAAVLVNPAPASAAATGYFALNSDDRGQRALVRDSWGLRNYEFLYPGEFSERGMEGIQVLPRNRIKFKSLATGAVYWTACGEDLWAMGYGWAGYPYYPVTGRSVQILDQATYPAGAAISCNG